MQETLNMLNYKHWYYETLRDEDIPAEFREARKNPRDYKMLIKHLCTTEQNTVLRERWY
jgi:hypothetical protein